MIPGLMGGADFPGEADTDQTNLDGGPSGLVDILVAADPDDLAALYEEAKAAYEAGELDSHMSVDAAPPEEELESDPAASMAPTELDAGSTATATASIAAEIAKLQSDLNALADAEGGSEADVDVEAALDVVAEALMEADEATAEAEAAVDEEDLDAANEAKAKAEGALEKAKEAYASVVEEAKEAAGGIEAPSDPDPLLLWAQAQDG